MNLERMRIFSKAPCRVDIAGSTLDIWPLYLFHQQATTINFAVDRYTTCELQTRDDGRIRLQSLDLQAEEEFSSLAELQAASQYRLPLLAYLVRFFAPKTGISMVTNSEAPAGAGISGSSSLMISASSAFNALIEAGHSLEKIREIAQNIEAQIIRVPTGSQDYYPAMYGGMSALEMGPGGIQRHTIQVDYDDFHERFVLAYTGVPRNSGINTWEVMKAHINGDKTVQGNFDRIAAVAVAIRQALEKSDWNQVAALLREEWENRRANAPGISSELIDRLVAETRQAGSTAAKVCGAGGGGCVLFLVERGAKERVAQVVQQHGAEVLPTRIAPEGVTVSTEA